MSIEDKVIAILADQALLEPGDVSLDDTLEDLGLDSMALVETIFALEETFDITVPYNANAPQESGFDATSVRSIVAGVQDLMTQRA